MNSPTSRMDDGGKRGIWSRREVFTRGGQGGFGFFAVSTIIGFVHSAFPRVLFQSPTRFKASAPMDYVLKGVNEKCKDRQRVWIVGEEDGFCALFAKCTHLGCTPRWLSVANKFECPCRGSGFYKVRTNFECPAPRPLDRFKIELGEDGQLLVDKGRLHHMKAGLDPDEQYPDSIIKA